MDPNVRIYYRLKEHYRADPGSHSFLSFIAVHIVQNLIGLRQNMCCLSNIMSGCAAQLPHTLLKY